MNAEIISVNADSSGSQFVKQELASFGIDLTHHTSAEAELLRLREALRLALSRNDLIVVVYSTEDSGGGVVFKAVSDVLGAPLETNRDSLERVEEFFRNRNAEVPAECERYARLPRGCTVFPNDHGCAPGCAVSRYGQNVLILPDRLSEVMPMFSDYVAPYLTILTDGTIVSRTIGVFGMSEAVLTERLADLMSEANPAVSLYAKDGEAILRVTARAADRGAAYALCDPVVEDIRQRLGVNVYGVDIGSLQKAVVALLLDKHMKIATAESCTAGMLSSRLTEVTGVSAVFECGIATYSPEIKHSVLGVPLEMIKKLGTVSPEVAGAMADGARKVGKADLGVSITGVAGPEIIEGKPVGTVYVALADEKRVWVKKIEAEAIEGDADRESIRKLATSHALDLVRRYLEALPTVMAGGEIIKPEQEAPTIPQGKVRREKQGILRRILPWKGDRKRDIFRKLALLVASVFLVSALASVVYIRVMQPLQNRMLFRDLAELYNMRAEEVSLDSGGYPEGILPQFYALYSRNPDIRGWVKIEGTNINYPVMMDDGNGFYKNHNFYGELSDYGVPYFSKETALYSPSSINRSIVIFGNNTRDGQMFSDLARYYNNIDFLVKHPVIEMNTIFHSAKWKIFSVMVLTDPKVNENAFDYTKTVFLNEMDFLSFAGSLRARSLYVMPAGQADVQEGDSILMLSTEFENVAKYRGARLVVAARKVREGEAAKPDLSKAYYNYNAIMPQEWRRSADGGSAAQRTTKTLGQTSAPIPTTADESALPTSADDQQDDTSVNETEFSTGSPQTTTTTAATSTTGSTTAGTTQDATTTTTTTTTTVSAPPQDQAPAILAGSVIETEFLQNCKVKIGSQTSRPANRDELTHLLARIVKTELGSAKAMENNLAAQKAQAVASYTYILYENMVNKRVCSFSSLKTINLSDATDKKIYDAVKEVAGIKLLSNGKPVYTPYFSSSPGYTANNHDINLENLPHLKSVVSAYEKADTMCEVDKWESEFHITMAELKSSLESYLEDKYQQKLTVSFEPKTGAAPFYVRKYDNNGQYVIETNAYYHKDGKKTYVRGNQLRTAVGADKLRSPAFRVALSDETQMLLSVVGNGHGVGLSQWGAANYAKYAGWDFQQMLSHYYSITGSSGHRLYAPVWN